jgi:pimeloyl-ACP methyl ester carboxylesterase
MRGGVARGGHHAMVHGHMATRVGPLFAEVTAPEADKFTAPLVLVHGLWERAPAWRRFAGYLAHRGWRCIALERRAEASDLAAHVSDLRTAIGTLEAAPVLIGHDLGALLALHCTEAARAVIALAPLVGPPFAAPPLALRRAGTRLARWRGAALRPPRRQWGDAYPARDSTEPAWLVREILAGAPPLAARAPAPSRAVFAVEGDEMTPVRVAAALAEHVGAELQVVSGSDHAALNTSGWDARVAAIHRWIIRHLGVDLLGFYDEAMHSD